MKIKQYITQRKIFWIMWETEQFWGTIDFHSIFFLIWKSMVPQNSLVTNFLQNIFLCVRQNKDIHTDLELLESMMTELSFFNYLFK